MAKKIGVVLALDGEKEFRTGMQTAAQQTKQAQSELKKLSTEYATNANSLEALTKKQEALTKARDSFANKQEAATKGLENANKVFERQKQHLEDLERQEKDAKRALEGMAEGSDEFKKQEDAIKDCSEAVAKQKDELVKCEGKQASWQAKVNEAEAGVNKMNTALNENEKYMREAEQASDKCATTIDKYGNEVKGATQVTTSFSEKLKQAAANKLMDLGVDAVRALGDGMKDAAKYVVDVGSTFESSMSEVGAISGASSGNLKKMETAAKALGSSTKFSASEVASGFKYMSLAGWETTDMLNGIDGVLNLAAASGMELGQASDMVTDYLSAFGLGAEKAAHMADMMAFAQANSNTSAQQLGEAYGNCAANLHSAGQDMETTTAFLEAMANQGTKGSEAGTQMSAIMSQITQKMKDGAIAIGDTSVAVADQNGNFRDLTDIMTDVEAATEGMGTQQRSSALSAVFNRTALAGVNQILNEGMDKISGYEDSLRSCDGAAEKMAESMQDNLQGDLTKMDSALEGLGIAAYGYIQGPLRGVVQGVTDVISGITDILTPQKTELETFLDDTAALVEQSHTTLENSKSAVENATTDVGQIEYYKDLLIDLNGVQDKDAFQKYQIKNAVDALADSIPQLAEAYDETTGSIDLTNQEIVKLMDNQKMVVMQAAFLDAQKEGWKALADAQMAKAMADAAVTKSTDELTAAMEENAKTEDYQRGGYGDNYRAVVDLEEAQRKAIDTQSEANAAMEEAQEYSEQQGEALKTLANQFGFTVDEQGNFINAQGEVASAVGAISGATDEASGALDDFDQAEVDAAAAAEENAAKIQEAYDQMREGIATAIEGSISLLSEFSGGSDVSAEQIIKNLDSQIQGISDWSSNMEELGKQVGTGFTQEMYDALVQMGPQSANLVQTLVNSMGTEGENGFASICEKWGQALDLQNNADVIANYTQAGKDMAAGAAEGFEEGAPELQQATGDALSGNGAQANSSVFQTVGKNIIGFIVEGVNSEKAKLNSAITDATKTDGTGDNSSGFQEIGKNAVDGITSGIESGAPQVASATSTMVSGAVSSARGSASQMTAIGKLAGSGFAKGISAARGSASSAGASLGSSAISSARSSSSGAIHIGYNISAGVASGIRAGQSGAINAAANMAASALAAAKRRLDIHSPSRAFRNEVGKMVGEGFAFGIKDTTSLAGNAATDMSNKVYNNATAWMNKYKKAHRTTANDEKFFWQNVLAHTKEGTAAYNNIVTKLVSFDSGSVSSGWKSKINSNFSVSKTTGSGKSKKKKTDSEYYSDVLSAAETYMKNQRILYDVSTANELAYWTAVQKRLKRGTQAWYDATEKINDLKQTQRDEAAKTAEAIAKAEEESIKAQKDALKEHLSVQGSLLSSYKTYYKVSAKAEADYWNIARQQFKAGTDERIEADQKYYDALQDFYDARKKLDEEYADDAKKINDDLIDNIQDLQDAYKDAVKSRKEDILSQMNLFEEFDSSGYDADTLLYNLKTQVAGLALWEQQLEELKKKGLTKALLEELQEMGPNAAASIYSLNQMTAEQLKEYQSLWTQKNDLASSQAIKENAELLQDTNKQISALRSDAQKELNALNSDYKKAVAELSTGISSELRNLVNKSGQIGEDSVSAMVGAIRKSVDSVDTYNSTQKVVSTVSNQLSALKETGKTIGAGTLDSIVKSMTDPQKLSDASETIVDSIRSKLTADLQESLGDIGINYSGIAKLNGLMDEYSSGSGSKTLSVDNSSLENIMQLLLTEIQGLRYDVQNSEMELDGEVVAKRVSEVMATESIRTSRGML